MDKKFAIKKDSLSKLYEKLKAAGNVIYAAQKRGEKNEFDVLNDFDAFDENYIQTIQSAKSVVFPRHENILKYKKSKQQGLVLEDIDASIPETVLFGLHPCDAAGFDILKSVFTWDYSDRFFTEKIKKLAIIGLSCSQHDDFCFCTSVGLSPASKKGSDILLTKLRNGDYTAEILTEKGQSIYESVKELFVSVDANNQQMSTDNEIVTTVPVKFDAARVTGNLANAFESPVWVEHSLRCLGCGACAYVCPTCSCFDIQDEGSIGRGQRVKCWDSCGLSNFTLHASGHNPREMQTHRWRQRVLHKFSYQPERLKIYGCVGCGRCSRACPVDMNLQEHLTSIDAGSMK